MSGSDHVGSEFAGSLQKSVELDFPVAQDIGVGGAALRVLVEHIVHHPFPVLLAQVNEIERDADFPGDHLGYELVFFPLTVTVKGSFCVMPVLHEHGKYVIALPLEKQSGHTGVHAS